MPYDPGLTLVLEKLGGPSALARRLGLTRSAVSNWYSVPARHLPMVARMARVRPALLRPDMYPDEVRKG